MKLTREVVYAFRIMKYLAQQPGGEIVARKKLVAETEMPKHFVAKIAKTLKNAKMLAITQGPTGGYELICDVQETTLLHIYEVICGPLEIHHAVDGDEDLEFFLREINTALVDKLDNVTVEMLASKE